jgi:hypothetical protein
MRGHGRNVGQCSANVSRFRLLPDAKLTRFEAGMVILLRKWCTFAPVHGFSAPLPETFFVVLRNQRPTLLPAGIIPTIVY